MQLTDRKWKAFNVTDVFDHIQRGKRLKNADHIPGDWPYISSSALNNGVADWIEPTDNSRVFGESISLANSGSVGTAFYEPFDYVASDHITSFHLKHGSKLVYLFMATCLEKQKNNFSFNREVNENRLKRLKIMLPVDDHGQPDYQFMADYERQLIRHKREQYLKYVSDQLAKLGSIEPLKPLDELKWNPVCVADIGNVLSVHDIYARERIDGQIPYVTSGSTNNGIGYFVGNDNKSKDFGVISVNRNGAVGEAFYHPYTALFGNDCRKLRLDLDEKHKYAPFFIAAMISKQKTAFSYSRKLGTARLKLLKVMLPVNDQGQPDYDYMEQYIKNKMIQKYKKYLEYLGK